MRGFSVRWAVMVAGTVALAGCGTSDYEQRMSARQAQLTTQAQPAVPLNEFYGYMAAGEALAGGAVNLRLPMLFRTVYNADSKDEQTGMSIEPTKLYPLGVPLPGYDRTYEAWEKEANHQWPMYLYVAASKESPGTAQRTASALQQQLKEKSPATPDAWTTVQLPTPDGSTLAWQMLRIEESMLFDKLNPDGNAEYLKMPGIVELYLYEQDGYQVIVGWRAPVALAESMLLRDRTQVTAGTVLINGR